MFTFKNLRKTPQFSPTETSRILKKLKTTTLPNLIKYVCNLFVIFFLKLN